MGDFAVQGGGERQISNRRKSKYIQPDALPCGKEITQHCSDSFPVNFHTYSDESLQETCVLKWFKCVQLLCGPMDCNTVTSAMGFSRQGHCRWFPCPPSRDLPHQGWACVLLPSYTGDRVLYCSLPSGSPCVQEILRTHASFLLLLQLWTGVEDIYPKPRV